MTKSKAKAEPAVAEPTTKPVVIPKPTVLPETSPNPFAPSIEPDTIPKG